MLVLYENKYFAIIINKNGKNLETKRTLTTELAFFNLRAIESSCEKMIS